MMSKRKKKQQTVKKTLKIRIVRPLLNEAAEKELTEEKAKYTKMRIPSDNIFWTKIKQKYPEIITWNELGTLLNQTQKMLCSLYNKAAVEVYSELVRKNFAVKDAGLNSILSKFGYNEVMKSLHNAYFALGVRQKLKSNFSGERLKELRRAEISLPVARSDTFPVPIYVQNGFKIEEITQDSNKDEYSYGDFVLDIPFPFFTSKTKIDKYKPWEKYDFEETSKKVHIKLLLSTKERKKIDRKTIKIIKKLKEKLKSSDETEKKKIENEIKYLQEKVDYGTQAEIRRVVKGEYPVSWIEINRGKRLGENNKWFVHLVIDVPVRDYKGGKNIIGGLDIGCNSPVYCAINNSFKRLNRT